MTTDARDALLHDAIAFWDFAGPAGKPHVSRGRHAYALNEAAGPVARVDGGPFGRAIDLREGQWLRCLRADCPALNLHGRAAAVTVVAWVCRRAKSNGTCEAVAGLWDETRFKRQYCLFVGAMGERGRQVGHVSGVGGPTPGNRYCWTGSVGAALLPVDAWACIGFTYDGRAARSYLNGALDGPAARNPEPYDEGLFEAGPDGADFTVGAVQRSGAPGPYDNFFVGHIGGLAVFDRALTDDDMRAVGTIRP